jgi:hypothetical protein
MPVQESLDHPAAQDELDVLVPLEREIQQPGAERGGDISLLTVLHAVDSRWGRMTFATRQILAKR